MTEKKSFWIIIILILISELPSYSDSVSNIGNQLTAKWSGAIITVQLVVTTSISYDGESGGKRETKSESTGTVIDPSGLIVMSLSATTPEEALSQMYKNNDIKVNSQITAIKILAGDGTELPAKIVLRDKDLDLAFLRLTKKPAKPMTAIDLKKAVKLSQFDEFIILYRLGNSANRQIAGVLDRVQTVISKPRPQYLVGMNAMSASLGAPVFAINGNISGLLLLRTQAAGVTDNGGSFSGISSGGMMYVVLPAEDILEAAKQAPAQ